MHEMNKNQAAPRPPACGGTSLGAVCLLNIRKTRLLFPLRISCIHMRNCVYWRGTTPPVSIPEQRPRRARRAALGEGGNARPCSGHSLKGGNRIERARGSRREWDSADPSHATWPAAGSRSSAGSKRPPGRSRAGTGSPENDEPEPALWAARRRLRRHLGKERQRVARTQSTLHALDRNEKDELVELYRQMVLIRRFEERAGEMYTRGKIAGFLHLAIGQAAANVGAVAGLKPDDDIFTHYRDHGHALARGLDPNALMAELFGRATGVAGGRGGSMHFADASKHFWGGYAIVGAHLPLAVGMAFARQRQGDGRVVMVIFGDGSTNTGPFHEAMNLAAVWKLPVIFFCENNLYGMGTAIHRASAETEMYKRGAAYNIESRQVDGSDVLAVR